VERGRKLLTRKVFETFNDIFLEVEILRFKAGGIELKRPTPELKSEFLRAEELCVPEFLLIAALAYYCLERKDLPRMLEAARKRTKKGGRPSKIFDLKTHEHKLKEFYIATPIVRKRRLIKRFDELLEWIEPLLRANILTLSLFLREHQDYGNALLVRVDQTYLSISPRYKPWEVFLEAHLPKSRSRKGKGKGKGR
jgi:hypothetical protein